MRIIEKIAVRIFKDIAFPELKARRYKRPQGDLRDFVGKHFNGNDNNREDENIILSIRGRVSKMAEEKNTKQEAAEQEGAEIEVAAEGEVTMKEVDKLKKDMDSLRKDLKDLTGAMKKMATGKGTSAKERIWQTASDIEDKAEDYVTDAYDTVRDHGERYIRMGREQIQNRPYTSAFWIFGAGFLLGKLLDRR